MSVVPHAQCHATLGMTTVNRPRKARDVGLTLLRRHSNVVDHQKRSGSVGAERPTDPATSREFAGLLTKVAPNTQSLCVAARSDEVSLITLKIEVTKDMSLRALVDCGASNNFVRRQSLDDRRLKYVERETPPTRMTVRLAIGASVAVKKRVVGILDTLEGKKYDDDFIVLELDDKFDVILGLPWLRRYEPWVSWQHRTVKMPAACSSDGHLMNVLERSQARECSTSECDGLTCGSVVSTTAQDLSVTDSHTVEQAAGGCAQAQAAPKVHHSNKSSGPGHECSPRGQHSQKSKPVAQKRQHGNPRSTGELIVEDLRCGCATTARGSRWNKFHRACGNKSPGIKH